MCNLNNISAAFSHRLLKCVLSESDDIVFFYYMVKMQVIIFA